MAADGDRRPSGKTARRYGSHSAPCVRCSSPTSRYVAPYGTDAIAADAPAQPLGEHGRRVWQDRERHRALERLHVDDGRIPGRLRLQHRGRVGIVGKRRGERGAHSHAGVWVVQPGSGCPVQFAGAQQHGCAMVRVVRDALREVVRQQPRPVRLQIGMAAQHRRGRGRMDPQARRRDGQQRLDRGERLGQQVEAVRARRGQQDLPRSVGRRPVQNGAGLAQVCGQPLPHLRVVPPGRRRPVDARERDTGDVAQEP
ncbi:hypothetical protein ACFFX1_14665 [Dactylosporangium sucinum]|uniref:Uncharacterized protein n=1 Tax=Dactylosporangium sucinum TaxID=1424081 RepID=A0A917UBH4_9ACTN|nr:hypothetical protein [Dactylosporangium sucinum]GGM69407.1 hypothetical protein GCM10007977_083940 [Dactylosporangium sucinum]